MNGINIGQSSSCVVAEVTVTVGARDDAPCDANDAAEGRDRNEDTTDERSILMGEGCGALVGALGLRTVALGTRRAGARQSKRVRCEWYEAAFSQRAHTHTQLRLHTNPHLPTATPTPTHSHTHIHAHTT